VVLDGELFAGRGKFQVATSIVRTKKSSVEHDEEWKQMKFCCFDAPDLDKPFEERMDYIKKLFSDDSKKFCVALEHELCKDRNHLETKLKEIESLGGEGLMLREPASAYVRKRSWSLLKVKSVETEEYRILKHLPGKGKYVGKVGGFECETKEGEKFAVGSGLTDKERENPPNVGSLITVQYQELSTKGVPRFPIYKGVCVDKG
jgi:DNA ligase-1